MPHGSSVLIVGVGGDPHIERVRLALKRRGTDPIMLDYGAGRSLTRLSYALGLSTNAGGGDGMPPSAQPFDDVTAIWWRPKPVIQQVEKPTFGDREWLLSLEALGDLATGARWINPRAVDQRCRQKPSQLLAAERAGLEVPPTVISNDARVVAETLAPFGPSIIYKSVSWFGAAPDNALFTTRLSLSDLDRLADNIAAAPGIFQPYVDKAYELRVTVVDDQVFAARIDSQSHDSTRTDWRRNPGAVAHDVTTLPPEIETRLLTFHREQGLVFGAYDFIVTPDGRHVFLEVNSVGQWLWVEELTGLPISDALAEALLRPA